jgi:hypothetical protein
MRVTSGSWVILRDQVLQKAIPQKEEAREKGPETPDAPLLLLDLSGRVCHQSLHARR